MSWLLDTSIVVDYLRGRDEAVSYVEARQRALRISVMAVAELYHGLRGDGERQHLEALLEAMLLVPVNQQIAVNGGLLARQWGPSHGAGLSDCIIAATAQALGDTLVTLNFKHFPMLTDVEVP